MTADIEQRRGRVAILDRLIEALEAKAVPRS
jgi:hypothetical protein